MRTNPWPTSFLFGRTSTFRMTKLEHSGNMSARTIRTTRMLSVHPCPCPPANSCSSTKLGVLPRCRPKSVVMKGNCFPGKEEERTSFRTAPCGLLEPWSQDKRTLGAMASHWTSHRGLAGRKGAPTSRSRLDTLNRLRRAVFTRILLKRLRKSNTLSCREHLTPMRTRTRTGRRKKGVASASFTGPPSGGRPSSTACSAHANNECSTKKGNWICWESTTQTQNF